MPNNLRHGLVTREASFAQLSQPPLDALPFLQVAVLFVPPFHCPHASFAISRSLNFCIFPVDVFGSSANTRWRGHL
jgi:hypothetical protein